jgi:cell wall-associated NlpC family hydrolase
MNTLPLLKKPTTSTAMNENVAPTALGTEVSLQESFRKFRDMKIRAKSLLKLSKNGEFNGNNERSASSKTALREKFISAAKSYIGVPYAERYKEDNEPVAFLYLDCCALVRRAVTDLQDDFGIVLGRWNQAYQMDTLPIVLSQSDLKPGDLIFYEGLYVSKRSKIQKHNTVHVEIFLGGETGEATIGARLQKGKVSIFPSFKFTSKTWTLVQYHFRSLDTWLNGECRSHCAEHPWHSDALDIKSMSKNSIFNCESDDESAGGDPEIITGENSSEILDIGTVPPTSTVECETVARNKGNENDKSFGCECTDRCKCDTVRKYKQPSLPSVTHSEADVTFPALQITRPVKIAANYTMITSRTKGKAAIDGLQPITGSAVLLQRRPHPLTEANRVEQDPHICSTSSYSSYSSSGRKHEKEQHYQTYYVGKSNGWRLVKDSLDRRGWRQLPFEYSFSSKYALKWVERRSQIDYIAHTPGQLVNHIPNSDCITTKLGLLNTLREKYCHPVFDSTERVSTPWLPETYNIDSETDILELFRVENQALLLKKKDDTHAELPSKMSDPGGLQSCEEVIKGSCNKKENEEQKGECNTPNPTLHDNFGCLWIYKPSSSNRGRGIEVVRGLKELKMICHGRHTGDPVTCIPPRHGILQRYIENPLLVGEGALKFDVRCYMLIACNDPSYTVYYHPGYCRLALKRYCTSVESLLDPMVHLTNASVQKKDPHYDKDLQVRIMLACHYFIFIFISMFCCGMMIAVLKPCLLSYRYVLLSLLTNRIPSYLLSLSP